VIREVLERCTAAERFNMNRLRDEVWPDLEREPGIAAHLAPLRRALGEVTARWVATGLLRHAFLIELVKLPAAETTKFRTRWFEQLEDDPRWCGFDECLSIAAELLAGLEGWLSVPDNAAAFELFRTHQVLPYEMPLDYGSRPGAGESGVRIHRRGNLTWHSDALVLRTLRLRKFLTDSSTSPDAGFFKRVLRDKIQVKTYLTDRALTGKYKTDREKRWETHPQSVQFSLRRTALEIEYHLVTQICAFDGFPEESRRVLQEAAVLPRELDTFRCPITLEPIRFAEFRDALLNPTHGKSAFQVGHLNPLKLDAAAGAEVFGHSAANISWISADGNRIQGNLCLVDVRGLLRRIAKNYERAGWVQAAPDTTATRAS